MKEGWAVKSIDEICTISGGGTPSKLVAEYWRGDIPWVSPKDMKSEVIVDSIDHISPKAIQESATSLVQPGAVLIVVRSGILARTIPLAIAGAQVAINQDIKALSPYTLVDSRFMFLQLLARTPDLLASVSRGATVHRLGTEFIRELKVVLPPLPEQQRIVAILDESFAAIATAKANAEKNLQNARAVFDAMLRRTQSERAQLGDVVTLTTGRLDANAAVDGGKYPFFTCSRDALAIDTFAFDCEAILLAGNNAVGDFNVKHYNGKFNAYQRTYVITIADRRRLHYRFLYYQLLKSLEQFKERSIGAATKFLKLGIIRELEISLPSIEHQIQISDTLDSVLEETLRLESLYRRKLAALDELKKSLLHRAFNGDL